MARNYDIAGFGTSDGLTPQVSEKLNANFRRMISLITDETPRGSEMATIINEVVVEGVDTDAIAAAVVDELDDDIVALDDRVDDIEDWIREHGGGGEGGGAAVVSDYIECYVSSNTAAGTTADWQLVDVPIDTVRTKYGSALSLATSGANNHGIVVSTPGYYRISGWISMNQPGYAGISINGTMATNLVISNNAGYEGCGLGYIIKYLDADDVIKLRVERSTSSDPTIAGGILTGLTVERMEGFGGVASYNDLADKPSIEGVVLSGDVLLNSASDDTDGNHGIEIHPRLTNLEIENFLRQADGLEPLQAL